MQWIVNKQKIMSTTISLNLLEFGIWLILAICLWKELPEDYTNELGTIVGILIEIAFTVIYIWAAFNYDIQIVKS
jgi:hypothetical protein